MQSETDWIGRLDEDEENGAAERYQYFMRPEPFEDLGPIEVINDPHLGPATKVRQMSVGMTRNASSDNKRSVRVFLQPFPHIRIEKAKPLQGWYKSLHEPPNVRPRPCFTDAILTEPYGGYCAVGCSFAINSGQFLDTPNGPVLIDELRSGDVVWGRTTRGVEAVQVGEVAKLYNEEVLEIQTTRGKIQVTGDHPVFANGAWVQAMYLKPGDILELLPPMSTSLSSEVLFNFLREPFQRIEESQNKTLFALQGSSSFGGSLGEPSESLRRLFDSDTFREREEKTWPAHRSEGRSEDFRDSETYAGSRSDSRHGGARKVSGQSLSVQRPFYEVPLGSAGSSVSGFSKRFLDLRTPVPSAQEWAAVYSRFSTKQRSILGGQRLDVSHRTFQTTKGQTSRLQGRTLERNEVETARIVSVTKIRGGTVYDLETSSENYYVDGHLVHNCYINSGIRGYRGTGLITVPIDYGKQIEAQLSKMRRSAAGYFSSFTDPFTPLENYYHNTQRAAEAFVSVGLPIFFLSRLAYPDWAMELLKLNPHSYAQKSINTPHPEDWRKHSPGAISLDEHLDEISELHRQGIYVSIQVNPIVPGVTTHKDVCLLFEKLKKAGADHVIVKFVEAGYSWAPAMVERIKKRFGEKRGSEFERLFTDNIGGQKTIDEAYRLRGHKIYRAKADDLGLTYATCYEYRYERNNLGEITSKLGVSIGREYTSADQCHGQMVPMYTRKTGRELFRPVEECPPSGCLYCASENGGEPRCGDELAGEANALKMGDLKLPIGYGQARNPFNPNSLPIIQ